jgi:thiol-disulfide isomerase/thioredoxin
MKIFTFIGILLITSCSHNSKNEILYIPKIPAGDILKDFNNFWSYYNKYVKFSDDFVGIDTTSKIIDRKEFFRKLSTGMYLPLKIVKGKLQMYQLYKLDTLANNDIFSTLKQMGQEQYKYCKMENSPLPKFDFIDLSGNLYNSESTKGKIVIIKCWFIKCQKCEEEQPALNNLITKNKNRSDIVFLSLAYDSENDLKKFISKTTFNCIVIPNQKYYLQNILDIDVSPTYIIINKKGMIKRIVKSYDEMETLLVNENLEGI